MGRKALFSSDGPAPVAPYSPALDLGEWVYLSGQLGLSPQSGAMVEGGTREQAEQALRNLSVLLEAAGLTLDSVVKTTLYLTDMGDFDEVNELYADSFSEPRPAREAVEVSALPLGAAVEIDAVARRE